MRIAISDPDIEISEFVEVMQGLRLVCGGHELTDGVGATFQRTVVLLFGAFGLQHTKIFKAQGFAVAVNVETLTDQQLGVVAEVTHRYGQASIFGNAHAQVFVAT
nr:hypothetical protein [Thiothrix subterranea]